MADYVNYAEMLTLIEEMVDEHTLTQEIAVREFETDDLNYEELRTLVCNKILQLMLDVNDDDSMSDEMKFISLASSMSYLSMENFVLHYERMKAQQNVQ